MPFRRFRTYIETVCRRCANLLKKTATPEVLRLSPERALDPREFDRIESGSKVLRQAKTTSLTRLFQLTRERSMSYLRMHTRGIAFIVATMLSISSCGGNVDVDPPPPGNGAVTATFSITSSPRQVPEATDADRLAALRLAYANGVRGQYISLRWSEIEPQPLVYSFQRLVDTLALLRNEGTFEVLIGIQTINTNRRELPADIAHLPFDDPQVIARFNRMLDALVPSLSSQVRYISIGNEVDGYLVAHPTEWSAYKNFVDATAPHVRMLNPQVRVGSTTTFNGASSNAQLVAALNANTDVHIFTYYPLNADFTPRAPSIASPDFARMRELAGNKPIVLQEVGYPTSSVLESSESAQATFYNNVFDAWVANQSSVSFLNVYLLHDPTQAECDAQAAYYGLSSANFNALLCSLGLRRVDGTPKAAWQILTDKARAAGLPFN
jgi:hypothetical protein